MEDEKIWSNENFSENARKEEEYLNGISDQFNKKIADGARVSFREACEALGLPVAHVDDAWYDDYGWDKDGFGRIYDTIMLRVPVSTKTGQPVLLEEELKKIDETIKNLTQTFSDIAKADVMFRI